ncbi:hypothetical protein [Epilithonimonas caeni]|uniref:hypothetical protein n=1 Tax=Epilithonimonas caeni TaxID=365343 RepID=UPI000401A646|nr:hypothetical protein [Epilithonimonas caeni]
MKLKATIRESIEPTDKSVIVEFYGDAKKQHFEVHCTFNPYQLGIRKWDYWEFKIRFQSEIFEEPKTKKKSYFTHLYCDEAKPVNE